MSVKVLHGDCRDVLATLPDQSVHMVVTSPPYYGLREYGTAQWEGGDPECDHVIGEIRTGMGLAALGDRYRGGGHKQGEVGKIFAKGECPHCGAFRVDRQIGQEQTPDAYVQQMVAVFREVRRVLRDDGCVFLNLGDSYASGGREARDHDAKLPERHNAPRPKDAPGIKPGDLLGIPWMIAFALRSDGWWLRQDNIWSKRNGMPESTDNRTTRAHEYIFQLTKSGSPLFWTHRDLPGVRARPKPDYRWVHRNTGFETDVTPRDTKEWRRINLWSGHNYFYDAVAIEEDGSIPAGTRAAKGSAERAEHANGRPPEYAIYTGKRNKRSVWWMATQPFAESHFAVFPPELPETCIKAGTSERGCCPHCHAPWSRQTLRSVSFASGSGRSGRKPVGKVAGGAQTESGEYDIRMGPVVETNTVGWMPTCSCPDHHPVPATVLDPFFGAGTTGLVADRLGRNCIGIELNPEYIDITTRRITRDAPLFAEVSAA